MEPPTCIKPATVQANTMPCGWALHQPSQVLPSYVTLSFRTERPVHSTTSTHQSGDETQLQTSALALAAGRRPAGTEDRIGTPGRPSQGVAETGLSKDSVRVGTSSLRGFLSQILLPLSL